MAVYHLQPAHPASQAAHPPKGGVWVLGFFDGLHLGHGQLFGTAETLAERMQRESGEKTFVGCWTFDALPKAQEFLTSPAERAMLMGEIGVEWLDVNRFAAVSHLSGLAFWEDLLLKKWQPTAIVCGFNFRFGYLGECGSADLVRWGQEAGVQVVVEKPFSRGDLVVSSTQIRSLVREGEMEAAAELLTRPYFLTGVVEHGKALGRKLGFPTANLRLPKGKVAPPRGVYACQAVFRDENGGIQRFPGVCNIGSRPTVSDDASDVTVEPWLLGFSGDLYGKPLTIYLCKKLRDERKFVSIDALAAQVRADGEAVLAWFAENPMDLEALRPGPVENALPGMDWEPVEKSDCVAFSTGTMEEGGISDGG